MNKDDTATTSTERDEKKGSSGDDLSGERHVPYDPNDDGTPAGFQSTASDTSSPVSFLLKPSAHRHQQRARALSLLDFSKI